MVVPDGCASTCRLLGCFDLPAHLFHVSASSGPQDKMLEGRSITIRKGPFRGMRGRVISATATHVRLELEAQMKTVTVDR